MTPEEAGDFYEDDEGPQEIFARYDAGPHAITASPDFDPDAQIRAGWDYIRRTYGRRE